MKLRATRQDIIDNSYRILSISYCELQYLLSYCEPFSYCCGVYGWNCDNYEITTDLHRIVISTGYRPISNHNCESPSYDVIRKYDKKAREIRYKYDYETAKKKVKKLLERFIDKEVMY